MTTALISAIEDRLRNSTYFRGLSDKSRRALAEICLPKNVSKKQVLFREGDQGHSVYHCVSGQIQLYKSTQEGKEIVIKTVKSGEIFAEVILFEQDRYPVSARMLSSGQVYIIPKIQIHCLLEIEDFRNDFISMLMKKQRYLVDQIKFLSTYDVEERLFLFIREQYGEKETIELKLSKKDVAASIGTTPESLSRLLLRLKQDRKLDWDHNKITIDSRIWDKLRKQ